MRTILLGIFIALSIAAAACSGFPKSFCMVHSIRTGDKVISGIILAKASHSLQLDVIDVFSGTESRSVITIWDGTDFDCNGNVSMKVDDMGAVGDTIIAILPVISGTMQNTWDVAGDYRRPFSLFETPWIKVVSDTVRGFIAGSPYTPIVKYPYTQFKSYWQSHSNDCTTLRINEANTDKLKVKINEGNITVHSMAAGDMQIQLLTIDGRKVAALKQNSQAELNCSHLPAGVYIIVIEIGSETVLKRKVIL